MRFVVGFAWLCVSRNTRERVMKPIESPFWHILQRIIQERKQQNDRGH